MVVMMVAQMVEIQLLLLPQLFLPMIHYYYYLVHMWLLLMMENIVYNLVVQLVVFVVVWYIYQYWWVMLDPLDFLPQLVAQQQLEIVDTTMMLMMYYIWVMWFDDLKMHWSFLVCAPMDYSAAHNSQV